MFFLVCGPFAAVLHHHHLLGYSFHCHRHRGFLASWLQDSLTTWTPSVQQESPIPRVLQDSHPAWIQAGVTTLLQNRDPTWLSGHLSACRPRDLQARFTHRGAGAPATHGAFKFVISASSTARGPDYRAAPDCHADQTGAS